MRLVLAVLAALLGAFVLINTAQAQRVYHQGELDAMLAPIALQPDDVVTQLLIAATYPEDVSAAARWSRANAHLRGEIAGRFPGPALAHGRKPAVAPRPRPGIPSSAGARDGYGAAAAAPRAGGGLSLEQR